MDEYQVYGKDGLFHNIVKQSTIMAGRYAFLARGPIELNFNNLLSQLDLPQDKYPLIACLPPVSMLESTFKNGAFETFSFRLLFLCTTFYTGDNKIKTPDPFTNTSMHTIALDWTDMKRIAFSFMNSLEQIQMKLVGIFRLGQKGQWRITRLTKLENDNLSGVMIQFDAQLFVGCDFTDINTDSIALPSSTHNPHYH